MVPRSFGIWLILQAISMRIYISNHRLPLTDNNLHIDSTAKPKPVVHISIIINSSSYQRSGKTDRVMEGRGTEAFPDLGRHCQHSDCHQLDFLPFKCGGCHKFFCLDHRSYKSHDCPKSDHNDRRVVVCEICSFSIEITGFNGMDEGSVLQKHEKSGDCDPKKKQKPKCPVRRCKEILTFSNTASCHHCHVKVCLKHRFPADHACKRQPSLSSFPALPMAKNGHKFLEALASRNGKDCGNKSLGSNSPPPTTSVKVH